MTMTVREINRLIFTNRPVVARSELGGVEDQTRIIRACLHRGQVEVLRLGSGRWARLVEVWQAK